MAVLLALPNLALADYKVDYAKGKKAAEEGEWAKVRELMGSANGDNPTPNAKARLTGMRFEPYVPKFYLGLAAYKTGDCASAMRYWNDEATTAIVNSEGSLSSQKSQLNTGLAACGGSMASTTSAASTASTTSSGKPVPAVPPTTPPVATKPAPPPISSTPSNPVVSNGKPPPVESKPVTVPPVTTPVATNAGTQSPILLSALDDYLRGRFEQAARASAENVSDRRAKFHVLILRAAAKHRLAMRNSNGAALLEQARADIRAAKSLKTTQTIDGAYFAPAFRAVFQATP